MIFSRTDSRGRVETLSLVSRVWLAFRTCTPSCVGARPAKLQNSVGTQLPIAVMYCTSRFASEPGLDGSFPPSPTTPLSSKPPALSAGSSLA